MTNEKLQNQFPSKPENNETAQKADLDLIPQVLGFTETDSLRELKDVLLNAHAVKDEAGIKEALTKYHVQGTEAVSQKEGQDYIKAQIGLIVSMGILRRDIGRIDHCIEDLDDAVMYAANVGYEDIAFQLELAIEELIK